MSRGWNSQPNAKEPPPTMKVGSVLAQLMTRKGESEARFAGHGRPCVVPLLPKSETPLCSS